MPNWQPETVVSWLRPSQTTADGTSSTAAPEKSLGWQLLTSAAWVVGIPAGITLLIIIAIWLTENVWMLTQHVLGSMIS